MDALLAQAIAHFPDFHSPTAQGLGHITRGVVGLGAFIESAEGLAAGGLLIAGGSALAVGFTFTLVGIGVAEVVSQHTVLENTLSEVTKSSERLVGKEVTDFFKEAKEFVEKYKTIADVLRFSFEGPLEKLDTAIGVGGLFSDSKAATSGTDIKDGVVAPQGPTGSAPSSGSGERPQPTSKDGENGD